MASKRVPLASNPNAVNSPLRPSITGKRARDQGREQRASDLDQAPPKKKQAVEAPQHTLRRTHALSLNERDGKVFDAKTQPIPLNDFQRRLAAAHQTRTKEQERRAVERDHEKLRITDKEQVKTWRKHYHKVFPSFVFYFENLPHDALTRAQRSIAHLGAREEKFFSKNVTHIVTTRTIPKSAQDADVNRAASSRSGQSQSSQTRTINPSLLEKQADPQWVPALPKGRSGAEILSQRRPLMSTVENETRRQPSSADILVKAKEMGIKMWPLDKFERMLHTLLDLDGDGPEAPLRKAAAGLAHTKHAAETDLSQLLKKEKHMPSDRLPWSDVMPFRGYFVYVHDVEESYRPVMVREYAKPADDKEGGDWPQLHSVQAPRCPFVDDSSNKRSDTERENPARAANQRRPEAPRTRAASAAIETTRSRTAQPQAKAAPSTRPTEAGQPSRQIVRDQPAPPQAKTFEPPQAKQPATSISDSLPAHLSNRFHFQGIPRPNAGREPLASGLQQSKPTSAIHSHMISSTAANPAARLGKSKEMHELQRRAVEQRRSGLSKNSNSEYANDIRAALNQNPQSCNGRGARRKAHEPMAKIFEDETQSDEEEEDEQNQGHVSKACKAPKKKKAPKREPKPGYCENCRDKYDDFAEHCLSKKHRKFAITTDNWTELDLLLKKLARK